MVASNGKFRLSSAMIAYLKASRLALSQQRFLLATMYFQSVLGDWPSFDWTTEYGKEHWMYLREFRALGCAPKSNDARHFKAAVEFWQAEGALFDDISLNSEQSYVSWRFSEFAFATMSLMDRYALMTAQDLSCCRSDLDTDLYLQLFLHHRMDRPEFNWFDHDNDAMSGDFEFFKLKDVDRKLKNSLRRLVDLTGYGFAVGYLEEGRSPGYTSAVIRVQHPGTKWPPGRILKFPPKTKQFTLLPQGGWPQQKMRMKP